MSARRAVLKWLSGAIACGLGVAIGVPAAIYATFPTRRRTVSGGDEPVDVGAADRVKAEAPVRVPVIAARRRDAWSAFSDVALGAAWLVREGGRVRAFSAVCPHAGCAVDWEAEAGRFACPCHASAFGRDGAKLSGPSPRGLDELDCEVRDGRVRVRWGRFRTGVPGKEPA